MGTEISEEDKLNIHALCDQVIALSEYRAQVSAPGWLLLVLRVRARVPPRPPLARAHLFSAATASNVDTMLTTPLDSLLASSGGTAPPE